MKLFDAVIGDYSKSVPFKALAQSGQGEGASPCLASSAGARLLLSSEPSANEKISGGLAKQLSGGDPVTARGLFKVPITFLPQFTWVIASNGAVDFWSADGGIKRRFRAIPFEQEYVEHPDANIPYQQQIDNSLEDRIHCLAPAMFHRLLAALELVKLMPGSSVVPVPQKVLDSSNDTIEDHTNRISELIATHFNLINHEEDMPSSITECFGALPRHWRMSKRDFENNLKLLKYSKARGTVGVPGNKETKRYWVNSEGAALQLRDFGVL